MRNLYYFSCFWDGFQNFIFEEFCIYPSEILHCKSELFGIVRKSICSCNHILSPLCLGVIILTIFSGTEAYCKGKRGTWLPWVQCEAAVQQTLRGFSAWLKNRRYFPKRAEVQVLCFGNIFHTKERRVVNHKWLYGIKFICFRRTESLAILSEVWLSGEQYQTWCFNIKLWQQEKEGYRICNVPN